MLPVINNKGIVAELCSLCEELYPVEFQKMYLGTCEAFRDWLNSKTDLNVDHITKLPAVKKEALDRWVEKLNEIKSAPQ